MTRAMSLMSALLMSVLITASSAADRARAPLSTAATGVLPADELRSGGADHGPRPDPGCAPECLERSRALYHACIDGGGNEESCEQRTREALASCIERCRTPRECAEGCDRRAHEWLGRCIEDGDDRDACRAEARRHHRHCLDSCRPPCPPPPPCELRCRQLAHEAERSCLDGGGTPEACREQAHAALEQCRSEQCAQEVGVQQI